MNRCVIVRGSNAARRLAPARGRWYSQKTEDGRPALEGREKDGQSAIDGISGWGFHRRLEKSRRKDGEKGARKEDGEGSEDGDGQYDVFKKMVLEEDWQMDKWAPIPPSAPVHRMLSQPEDEDKILWGHMKESPVPTALGAEEECTPSPYTPRRLPTSPFMDSALLAARQRYTLPKARRSKHPDATEFQLRLRKNPYALALATPLRECDFTSTTCPSYFLIPFNLLEHPETGEPWYLPRSLTNKHSGHTSSQSTPTMQNTIYTLASYAALKALQTPQLLAVGLLKGATAKYPILPFFLSKGKMRLNKMMTTAEKTNWRPDMHSLVLELLRRRLFGDLMYIKGLKRGYIVGCMNWEDAKHKNQVGAYLWTGGTEEGEEEGPGEFATLDLEKIGKKARTKKIPVHNLRTLLGKEKLAALREKDSSKLFEREIIAVTNKNMTTGLQMKLWKLQGYMAGFETFLEDPRNHAEVDAEGEDVDDYLQEETGN